LDQVTSLNYFYFLIIILGSSKKLDLEEEIDLESDMNVGDMDDLDDDELSLGE